MSEEGGPRAKIATAARRLANQKTLAPCRGTRNWRLEGWEGIRTTSSTVSFSRPFMLTGMADKQPPGSYTVEIDEEPPPHVSLPAYRRIKTLMRLTPRRVALSVRGSSIWIRSN